MARKRRGRGEGSIEELPSGAWRVIVSAGQGPDGKRRKATATFPTKKEAMAWREEQLTLLRRGLPVGAGKRTLADWLAQWLETIKPGVANNTWAFYEHFVQNYLAPQIGHVRL